MIIQKDPLRSLGYIQTLLNLARKKNKKQVESACGALKDLFTVHLGEEFKMQTFSKNSRFVGKKEFEITNKDLTDSYFEH